MSSNNTLDAAKTSRMLQVLQDEADEKELLQLVQGILLGGSLRAQPSKMTDGQDAVDLWAKQSELTRGLQSSFAELMQKRGDYCNFPGGRSDIFHRRDLTFLLRYLARA